MQYIVKCKDGRRWAVLAARSLRDACNAINMARATGSVGQKDLRTQAVAGAPFETWPTETLAHVHQINSDGTLREPYTEGY